MLSGLILIEKERIKDSKRHSLPTTKTQRKTLYAQRKKKCLQNESKEALILEQLAFLGITVGALRWWSNRSYKARWQLRFFLCILNVIAFQKDIYGWCRDHRIHHKFTDTDADPHNIKRGFFFAHIGWLLCEEHPDVTKKEKVVFLDVLWADPIVRFQRR
ncbi:Acyl-CoA Delta(11) desaturase [Araneus ventricosus]|uniref:Acyl-CoA Delta(11) desaturase n=1 Tax=Araneus ventricosus TaxID=182803 RepID=A0A4Y2E893_ARAVE|nr:Acyl-CoA Delta(11) desaturase [Araneus ventricosus]